MPERVLTIRQPWADLIMAGVKTVENRTWPVPSSLPHHYACDRCGERVEPDWVRCGACLSPDLRPDGPFPFRLWVHAAKQEDPDAPLSAWEHADPTLAIDDRRFGALLGSVTVTGCHHADQCVNEFSDPRTKPPTWGLTYCTEWSQPDAYHWTLTDPQPLDTPIPMRGRQGLWKLEEVPADA